MKRILSTVLVSVLFVTTMMAQSATAVLDKAAQKFKSAGGVKIGFSINNEKNSASGTIRLKGQKFCTQVSGTTIWFNGKTLWTYVKANEEVNVTTPSASETAKINPYAFLSIYKSGYKATFGTNTSAYYEVVLTSTGKSTYNKIVARISKTNYHPIYISMSTGSTTMKINVNSYQTGQNYTDDSFVFDKKKYPNAEVIDLR